MPEISGTKYRGIYYWIARCIGCRSEVPRGKRGEPTVPEVWHSWCNVCRRETVWLNAPYPRSDIKKDGV